MTWEKCCEMAIDKIKKTEVCDFEESDIDDDDQMANHNKANLWISKRTLMQWFRDFRYNKELFVNIPKKRSSIDRLPPFLDLNPDLNPDLKDLFLSYARENLAQLSPELMLNYVNDECHCNLLKDL